MWVEIETVGHMGREIGGQRCRQPFGVKVEFTVALTVVRKIGCCGRDVSSVVVEMDGEYSVESERDPDGWGLETECHCPFS